MWQALQHEWVTTIACVHARKITACVRLGLGVAPGARTIAHEKTHENPWNAMNTQENIRETASMHEKHVSDFNQHMTTCKTL